MDREEQEVFNLTVVAVDHGSPQLSTSQVLSVRVIDVNDEAPVFQRTEFEATVLENKGPGTSVLTVTATDRDQGLFQMSGRVASHLISETIIIQNWGLELKQLKISST